MVVGGCKAGWALAYGCAFAVGRDGSLLVGALFGGFSVTEPFRPWTALEGFGLRRAGGIGDIDLVTGVLLPGLPGRGSEGK